MLIGVTCPVAYCSRKSHVIPALRNQYLMILKIVSLSTVSDAVGNVSHILYCLRHFVVITDLERALQKSSHWPFEIIKVILGEPP